MVTVEEKLTEVIKSNDSEFQDFVEELLNSERLVGQVVIGIAKKIVSSEKLSDKQISTFIEYGLLKDNYVDGCYYCGDSIEWSSMIDALEDECCDYHRDKIEELEND
ncbi:hypothetical protein ACTFQO_24800 [Bacillus cereus group sp. MYBK29-1]|uniref:hypothetical protein n=1 Tax=Bacillus cereus group sp. MYBK29-1 TaxID=3450637 RepID=UPI003F7952C6